MFGEKKQKKKYTGVRDEIREQQKKTKDMTPRERLAYFWFYYKVPDRAGPRGAQHHCRDRSRYFPVRHDP